MLLTTLKSSLAEQVALNKELLKVESKLIPLKPINGVEQRGMATQNTYYSLHTPLSKKNAGDVTADANDVNFKLAIIVQNRIQKDSSMILKLKKKEKSTAVDLLCEYEPTEKYPRNINVIIAAIPFNGLVYPEEINDKYTVLNAFIANPVEMIEYQGKKYRHVLYLTVMLNNDVSDKEPIIDFSFMTINLKSSHKDEDPDTYATKHTIVADTYMETVDVYSEEIGMIEPVSISTLKQKQIFIKQIPVGPSVINTTKRMEQPTKERRTGRPGYQKQNGESSNTYREKSSTQRTNYASKGSTTERCNGSNSFGFKGTGAPYNSRPQRDNGTSTSNRPYSNSRPSNDTRTNNNNRTPSDAGNRGGYRKDYSSNNQSRNNTGRNNSYNRRSN